MIKKTIKINSSALYILSVREEDYQEIIKKANEASKEAGEIMSTAAEQLIEEGMKKGKRQEQIEIARNMIKENIELKTIKKVTGLSLETIQKISKDLSI